MKKFAILGVSALLCMAPAFAACGRNSSEFPADPPSVSAPGPQVSAPDPQLPELLPQLPEETPEEMPKETPKETPEEIPEKVPEEREDAVRYIHVRVNGLNVRSGAGTACASIGQAQKDTLLLYDGAEGGWYRTRYLGRTAYVSANETYASLRSLEVGGEKIEAVIGEGMALLGTPYVYGAARFHDGKGNRLNGFTTDAFDCSSLMQYIFYRGAGVLLDVTTRTQVKQGAHVEAGDLRRGDLMFFTNASRQNKTGLERVGHVALYLGENYILHTASDFAKVEQISAARWNYFLEARRVL